MTKLREVLEEMLIEMMADTSLDDELRVRAATLAVCLVRPV